MASLQALPSAVLFLMLAAHACMASILEDRCDYFAGGDKASYDYCVRTLRADRASGSADERGLAAIAVRIARASAKATGDRIARLQGAETGPARRDALATCAAEYRAAVRRLGRAARDAAPRGGDAGLRGAQTLLAEVLGTAERCDGAFAAAGQASPLSAADRGLDDVVGLALSILPSPRLTRTKV